METIACHRHIPTGLNPSRNASIFVVDDEPTIARTMMGPLVQSGFRTRLFRNPRTALLAFTIANPKPSLLITDLMMPQMNGLDLAQQCRQLHPPLKIIVTGWRIDTQLLRRCPLTPITVLEKPICLAKLTAALQTLGLQHPPGSTRETDASPAGHPGNDSTMAIDPEAAAAPIYVVDDKAHVAEMISGTLGRCGFLTEVFQNPRQAVAAFASAASKPALLITDFSMPDMDGLELMRRCRQISPSLKAILISGTVNVKALRGCGVGADFVLNKPLSLRELVTAVRSVFDADADAPIELASPRKHRRLWDSRPSRRPLIYVVDDEFVLAQMVSRQLLRSGYRTRTFESPLVAWSTFAAADPKPALLIADLDMPGMGGPELMRRCRERVPALRILAMSQAASTPAEAAKAKPRDADAILTKPFTPERLLANVKTLVNFPSTP